MVSYKFGRVLGHPFRHIGQFGEWGHKSGCATAHQGKYQHQQHATYDEEQLLKVIKVLYRRIVTLSQHQKKSGLVKRGRQHQSRPSFHHRSLGHVARHYDGLDLKGRQTLKPHRRAAWQRA